MESGVSSLGLERCSSGFVDKAPTMVVNNAKEELAELEDQASKSSLDFAERLRSPLPKLLE